MCALVPTKNSIAITRGINYAVRVAYFLWPKVDTMFVCIGGDYYRASPRNDQAYSSQSPADACSQG
jgi:hypothetical protein